MQYVVSARKKRNAPFRVPDVPEAQVRAAFDAYLKFCAALRTEPDDLYTLPIHEYLAWFDRDWRQAEAEAALIVALAKIWQEWKGTSPRTVGTDSSKKLRPGQFPFGEWVVDLFKAEAPGEIAPSRYAIQKAIRKR
jgi:hypothetical protein